MALSLLSIEVQIWVNINKKITPFEMLLNSGFEFNQISEFIDAIAVNDNIVKIV